MDRRRVLRRVAATGLVVAPAAGLLGGGRAEAAPLGTVIDLVDRGLVAGDTDAHAVANAAVWEAATVEARGRGAKVLLPGSGVYRFAGPLHLDHGVHYESDGATLKLAGGSDRDLMRTRGFETLWDTTSTAGPAGWSLVGFTLDGNAADQSVDCFPLSLWGRAFTIERVHIRDGRGGGLRSGNGPGGALMEARLRHLTVQNNAKLNVDWRGPNDSQFSDVIVFSDWTFHMGAAVPGSRGVRFSVNANGAQVDRLHVWGFFERGLEVGSTGVAVYNGVVEGSQVNVWMAASSCVFDGTIFGTAGTGPYKGTEVGYRLGAGTPGVTHWNNRLRGVMHRWSAGDRPVDLVADNGTDIDVSVLAGTAGGVIFGRRDYKTTVNVACADQPRFSERAGGLSGVGAPRPELGVVGSLYTRVDGGTGSYLYRKTSATAWTAIL
ncbi:hypothetical protein [Phytohabitans suffuscus]|uniref:Pectate lyase superfamily protein domain-containing protein n=1 Tax=Phytohabitans suffuscus TaxID=624315 RepID=A0A6F8YRI0_9ACTN|nr:hypothetical protein [Phytohabitans suffuscus]BCB88760.1 hypothetical protein Psuf_060730 [Phytohabitans suffuscus]